MYDVYYKLSAEPFRLSPDYRFCFQHRAYRKALTYMRHALHRAEGFIMITGRPGTGKTTLIHDLLRSIKPGQVHVANLVTTQWTADDLIRLVAYSYHLKPEGADKVDVLIRLVQFLKMQHQQGRRSLLIVDEAQGMTEGALEELRLLTNIESDGKQLLQIFLVGQEQLRGMVYAPSMEQLHQRMIAATHLDPLDCQETEDYIKHRLRVVAWTGNPLISKEAYAMIQQHSRGIPRQINQICSRLFLHGSIEEKHRLGLADLKVVIDELREELLMPAELAEAVSWPADLHQESYEEAPHFTATTAASKRPPLATPTGPKISPVSQETVLHPTEMMPGIPANLPENQLAAEESPAISGNYPDCEGQAIMTSGETATGTESVNDIRDEHRLSVARQDLASEVFTPGTHTDSKSLLEEGARQTKENTPVTALKVRAALEPLNKLNTPEGRLFADASPEHAAAKIPQRSATNRVAARKQPATGISDVNLTDRVPDQSIPVKPRKRNTWRLLLVTGLLTILPLVVIFNKNIEIPGLLGQSLMALFHSDIQKTISAVTIGSSPDNMRSAEKTSKESALLETPVLNPKSKPEPAEIEIAVQKQDRILPHTRIEQLEEKLKQNGLLVERMDDDALKVNLSSDGMFAFDSAQIKNGARPALVKLADVLRKLDEMTIQIVGHTDSSGAAEYNLQLSQRRAKAVADYLISQGLSDASIQSEGRGDRDTKLDDTSSVNPDLKRRVEIYIRQAQTP